MRYFTHLSKKSIFAIIAGLLLLCAPSAWGATFTIDCTTSSSDALFAVSGNGTQYDYNSRWTSSNLIKMDKGSSITITNVTGVAITAITAEGVADNNSNQTVNFTITDGTTSAQTSSGSWNNRKTATTLTSKAFNATNVGKLKHGAEQTYTITNNSSSSYNAGVRFVITYTESACVAPTSVGISGTTSYTEGEDISLTAAATGGTGTASYQWYKDGTEAGNKITGATNATYTKASCTTGDAGNYYCEVSTGSGSTCSTFSSACAVSVAAIPTTKTVYLKPGVWKTGESNERFAVYCYYGGGEEWYDMSLFVQNDCDGTVYQAEVDPKYETYIFCRMNNGDAENKWGNKWNQTDNMTAADGEYAEITGWGSGNSPCNWGHEPYNVCVSGTWLAFKGETITLNASCAGATHFQWYKDDDIELAGQTSATLTIENCDYTDGGKYYCKAWRIDGDANRASSEWYGVRVPRLAIQTGGTGGDRQDIAFVRANTSAETATCEVYLGVAWEYEYQEIDGIDAHGNTGTMTSDNCTNWTMDQINNSKWCRIQTTKEGTYHFTMTFSNSTYTPVVMSVTYPPMAQRGGVKVYIENTPAMQERGWDNNSIYYRIGKGKYDDGDTRNWTTAQKMDLVPGTARYLYTTTPDWKDNFWVWHIANNAGWAASNNSIYKTNTGDSWAITESSNFHGDELISDRTIYLNSTPGAPSTDPMNSNCQFYGYTHSDGMLTHNFSTGATTHGQIRVEYTHHDNTPQSSEDYTARNFNGLAHTCKITITGVPDCGYRIKTLKVNGVDFTSGSIHILDADATVTAEFEIDTYTVTLHTNGGTINSGNVSEYTYLTGATLPTDITRDGKDFDGWYDNEGFTGTPVDVITTTDCGNKEYWAKWIDEVPKVTYILGSCYVKNGMWTQGSDGSVKAWLFQAGATPAENTLKETTDISYSSSSTGGVYFNTKDITLLDNESYWNTSSGDNRAIKALKVVSGSTLKFNLSGMIANKISFYVFPNSKDAYSIDLTVNGATTNHAIAAGNQHKWHKFAYKGGNYSGEFSITSNGKETRVVVIVEVPLVTVTFDKNAAEATGTMEEMVVPKGSTFALNTNMFAWTDHTFLGWTEDAGGAGILISDEADYSTETDVTLYAKWQEVIRTTITLMAPEAYNNYTKSVVAYYGNPMPEIASLPKRTGGYVFEGYYDEENGAGTKYYGGSGNSVRDWDKTAPTATLYANWLSPCDLEPTLTNVVPVVTIWDQKKVDQGIVKLSYDYDATGVDYTLQNTVLSEPIPGCTFSYFDEYIHIIGTPALNNATTKTVTATFTIANSCEPAHTYTITATIRIYPANQKAKIAFIITGTEGGAFNAYSASDATSCDALVSYLSDYYEINYVNGYATKDEAALAAHYDPYDLLIVTDFLVTSKGYTNALGTLIDKKPILSFEAYVANLSNWHIGSNPKDPKPKVKDMKVLCAGHAIFKNAKYDPGDASETIVVREDTTVNVLSSLSSAKDAKGLQGFTINEAPDFVFLATIKDENNNRDLVVCCERQVVFPARLLLYGINFYEMPNLSNAGKIVMLQMIDYLLMTDETKVADCSLVFDNGAGNPSGGGDHLWSNPANWAPGYNIVPTPYHPTRIIAECHVNVDDAHAGSVKVNKGRDEHDNPVDGKLIVKPYGGLTIAGMVATVKDTRYASPITIKAEDLLIEADETHNGAFVYGNKESDVRATVQYYSRGNNALTKTPDWQYMGIPFRAGHTAIEMYRDSWMCRWTSATTDGLGGLWQWVENDDVLLPFEGYCITQEAKKTYERAGKLNAPITTIIDLDHRDGDGFAFAANSWTAPIKIQEMADEDFVNAERAIYIYHTGSYKDWEKNGTPVSAVAPGAAATNPGQYAVIPIHSSPYLTGADSVIPAMQGFFVKATSGSDPKLKLVYNRVVYDAKYFKTSTQPMRAPQRYGYAPEVMVLQVAGASFGDRVHILSRDDFSEAYEDGWDGRKIEGDTDAPKLAVVKEAGEMSVAAVESADEHYLSFRAGKDSAYTFSFEYEGEPIYLYDQLTGEATLIQTGNTYTFTATNKTVLQRFLITTNPPRVPTDVVTVSGERSDVRGTEKFIHEGNMFILHGGAVYDALGKRVIMRKEGEQ